ncbi:response regulator transcription factor [Aquitalea sp. ASV11]|uniref:response regulator transcription factor n=1 Tax=Aquitalea sp. ASV11 TaxID=2795103 RepID=UPI0018EC64AA|nr:response regulator transcription factor [Aquitalea sp. ASV11]
MNVLIVEDDPQLGSWLHQKLEHAGHHSTLVDSGNTALSLVAGGSFDAIVLDRMLPDIDGLDVLQALHGQQHPPVMVLSAVDAASDRVAGLRAGADDYLGKPFNFTELLVRLEILVRRCLPDYSQRQQIGDLLINYRARKVSRAGLAIELTEKEFDLLCVLAETPGKTVSRSVLLEKVWGYQFDPQTNLIDVHVSKLRSKLDRQFDTPLIRTIRAVGYALG